MGNIKRFFGRRLRRRFDMDKSQIRYDNTVRNLKKEGWKDIDFHIDLKYLEELGIEIILKETGNLVYNIVHELTNPNRNPLANLLSVIARSENEYWSDYFQLITPNPVVRSLKNRSLEYNVSSLDTGLDYKLIKSIVSYLGQPKEVYQEVREGDWGNSPSTILMLPIEKFTRWEDLSIKGSVNLIFDGGIEVEIWKSFNGQFKGEDLKNGEDKDIKIYFPSKKVRSEIISRSLKNVAIIKTKNKSTIGKTEAKYPLASFNKESLKVGDDIRREIIKINSSSNSEKLAILLEGKPGVGKTSLVNAVIKEIVSPLDYLVINLDLESLSEYTPLPYIDKVCLVINDGDNLALAREERKDGFTEKVMSLLDGNYLNCIDPIDNNALKLIIFITANTTERWDSAALRKGRIDVVHTFNEPTYGREVLEMSA